MIEKSSKIGPRLMTVGADEAGQRIDNYLIARLKGVPRSHVYRLLRKGEVRVNKSRIKAGYRLAPGDRIRLPPMTLPAPDSDARDLVARGVGRRLENHILYEDDWVLVVNKPAGVPVHGGSGLQGGVIEGLRQVRPQADYLELVHRLDKDTSGCLLIAKRRQTLRSLHQAFREERVDKRYLALLAGVWSGRDALVDAPLRRFVRRGGERFVRQDPEGKPSRTRFRTVHQFADATLVEAQLLTGRTHQIRVHAACLGHPVVGDSRYGDEAVNRNWRRRGLRRLFLHAWRLNLHHPAGGAILRLEAPLEPALAALLTQLDQEESEWNKPVRSPGA